MSGLIGKKIGMTSFFDAKGKYIPCTVIEAGPCVVTQVKTNEKDGYAALTPRPRGLGRAFIPTLQCHVLVLLQSGSRELNPGPRAPHARGVPFPYTPKSVARRGVEPLWMD